jgi:non-heme chloroperoxidase
MRAFAGILAICLAISISFACPAQTVTSATSKGPAVFHDMSPHRVQMVTVDKGVWLEVLDWGGTGRPVVLLAGLGNTAHIYDDFAPKLAKSYHVYGITRRGFGASSSPATGYSVARLGEDVVAVLDALNIKRPVLVGHSFSGQELSWVATKYPEKVAGLIYLDAAYSYAYYNSSVGDFTLDLQLLQKKLNQLDGSSFDPKLIDELLQSDLPEFERDLRQRRELLAVMPKSFSPPTAADRASFAAYRARMTRDLGGEPPESELHETFKANPDGTVGGPQANPAIFQQLQDGGQKFTSIHVPVLAIFACPHDHGPSVDKDPAVREKLAAVDALQTQAQATALQRGIPGARVILWPNVYHYLFISREADVLREVRSFINTLPQ